jgi:hypothetical protein
MYSGNIPTEVSNKRRMTIVWMSRNVAWPTCADVSNKRTASTVYSKEEGNTILQKVVSKHQTTRRHIPGDDNLRSRHRQNLASDRENFVSFNFHNVVVG